MIFFQEAPQPLHPTPPYPLDAYGASLPPYWNAKYATVQDCCHSSLNATINDIDIYNYLTHHYDTGNWNWTAL